MNPQKKQMLRSFVAAGLLPLIAFTAIEEYYGTIAGLVAGMIFGVGEILYEWRVQRRVDPLTWGGNGLLLVLGGISLLTGDGVLFKLQPSILEGVFALVLVGSAALGKPVLSAVLRKQIVVQGRDPKELPGDLDRVMRGMTLRIGLFFAAHAALAAWAAFRWSTAAWAALKGVGFTVTFVVYMVAESLVLRYRFASRKRPTTY